MDEVNKELLIWGAGELGVKLSEEQIELFERYLLLLNKWNAKMNLTAIREEEDQIVLLLLDSLAVVPAIEELAEKGGPTGPPLRIMDLGSGTGAPGIPVKIARPEWEMTLVESREKKATFLKEAARELGLSGLIVLQGRAEDTVSGKFDIILAKAVGDLGKLTGICGRLLRTGGALAAMKGPDPDDELKKDRAKIEQNGFRVQDIQSYQLPQGFGKRRLVILETLQDR